MEQKQTRYPEYLMKKVREHAFNLDDENDKSRDSEFNHMSEMEFFTHVCQYDGLLGTYAERIRGWIHDIFEVDLNDHSNSVRESDNTSTETERYIGDVHPLQHGGAWIKKIGDTEYNIIKVEPCQNRVDYCYFYNVNVDLSDNWLKLDSVKDSFDSQDDFQLAVDCVGYYGAENFGQSHDVYIDKDEARDMLLVNGIELDDNGKIKENADE